MKKIKSGKELVEEVRKIEKNINAGCTISSLLELSVAGISLEEQDDPELQFPSDQDEDKRSTTLEEVKEASVDELEEPEIHLPIVIQERDESGLSYPLNDMSPYDLFATPMHCMMPSLKVDLKNYLLGHDHTHLVSGTAHIFVHDTYVPDAIPMLNETCDSNTSIELTDFYHPKHVLYSYAYVIGYSIDDLEGIIPTACIVSFVECSFRFLILHRLLHAVQVRGDIPWDPGGFKAW
ncbi:unnamed protein product [Triticum turgidum subsp. durum]|uniref:Uncharacterized protein n=1 Tax=Triticum turgidum subsp. durum TaxID=4567 RepID=A0A9R0U414_TRITD|nr:unnamed protein product [Triticum turgidum subsp. durum]